MTANTKHTFALFAFGTSLLLVFSGEHPSGVSLLLTKSKIHIIYALFTTEELFLAEHPRDRTKYLGERGEFSVKTGDLLMYVWWDADIVPLSVTMFPL